MAPAPGSAFFSTEGGRYPPRAVPEPPNAPVARNPTTSQLQVYQLSHWLRQTYPRECNQIFKGYFDIGDYFDPYDCQLLGTDFLQEVLDILAEANHNGCSIFATAWAAQNQDKVEQVRDGEGVAVFSQAEMKERGRMFLLYALAVVRKNLVIWAKKRAKADSGQAIGAQPGTEAGSEAEETPKVKVSTSQPQAEDHHEDSLSLAPSSPPEDNITDHGQPAGSILFSSKELPKPETHVTRSNESEKKQEIAQTSASSPCATKTTMLAPPTPRTTVSSPATLVNNYQRRSPHRHIKSQASTHKGPAFNPHRGTQGPQYQPPGNFWMNMHDARNKHPPVGFISPPPAPHASLDQMVMAGPGFMPMQSQSMMPGAPFPNGNQWQSGMPFQKQHQAPPRFGHRNSVDRPPVFISNTLKADMSRQATPQMQNAHPTQQPPFIQHPGSFGPLFPKTSPYLGNAALGNMTNVEHQYGSQVGNRRRVSASRHDYIPPPQLQHNDGVFLPLQNSNDSVVQPVRDRRPSFAGGPGRRSRRGSFRGGHSGTFHDRQPSDHGLGANNLPHGAINTEPFPSYTTPHNPLTIYVANFPDFGTDMEHAQGLRTLFSNRIGKSVENVMVRVGRTNRRYALISFFHANDIQEALKLHSTEYMGMRLQVNLKEAYPPNPNGSLGYRNTQAHPRAASGSFYHHEPAFSMNSGKMGAGNNQPTRNRNMNDRRSFTNGNNRPFNTKYSPQDARSTIPTQDSDSHIPGIVRPSTAETGIYPKDAKRIADGGTAESLKSGRSTPSIGHQGSSTKAKKKTRREEAASVKSEGGGEKITTIHEETSSGHKVQELFLNPRNELVDESGNVMYKVKVGNKREGKAIASGKTSETESSREKGKKDSTRSSDSRQQPRSMNRSASVDSSKASKQGHDESPARGRQRRNQHNHEPEPTQNSESSSMVVEHSDLSAAAGKKGQNHHEPAPKTTVDSDARKISSANLASYAKAAANFQTPEKGSEKKSKPGVQPENSGASPGTPSTVTGTPGPTASPEGNESFVTAQENAAVIKQDKQGRQHASKKCDGKRSLPSTTPKSNTSVHGDENTSSASSPVTVVGPPSTNKWMELTPGKHSIADMQKLNDSSDAPKPKEMIKSQEVSKSEDFQTSIEVPMSDGPTKPSEAISSGETMTSKDPEKSVEAPGSAEAYKSAESPEPTELPKVAKTPETGGAAKDEVALKSNASDSTVGEEQFFTPPPQKAEFDVVPENPMQERPPNVEASGSKSGPKQTSSIHPFARQKDQKKKKSKKNKKEQHKGPLCDSKNTSAMRTMAEPHGQVLFEHLSSEIALDHNDNQNQQIKSHQSILDSRLRNPIPITRQVTLDTQLTPTSSTVSKSERRMVVESGSTTSDGLDSTVYSTTLSDGGSQSGDQAEKNPEEYPEKIGGLETDVEQSFVKAEDTPAGEPGDVAGPLRTADHAAGEWEAANSDETSNSETSHLPLADAKPSVAEGSQTCASDSTDVGSINLTAKQKQSEKARIKAKAKKQRQRAAKRAQEEQEKELRSGDESHVDPEVHGDQLGVNVPFDSSKDKEYQDSVKVVERHTQHENPNPVRRGQTAKTTPHDSTRDRRLKYLCSNALKTLQELDDTGPASNNYAVPAVLDESDDPSDELEVYETNSPNGQFAGTLFPHPFPPPKRSNASGFGAIGNQAQSSLDLRGAQSSNLTTNSNDDEVSSANRPHSATLKSQDNRRFVDGVEEPPESCSPCKKLVKGKGKRRAHEMNEPVEAANVPGKPSTPSYYDDFEIDADKQSRLQRDDPVPSDATSSLANGENLAAMSEVISGIASMKALLDLQLGIENFFRSPENNTSPQMSEDRAEDMEEEADVEEANDGGEDVNAAAGSSQRKVVKKKSKKGKKKGKNKW